MTAAHPSCYPFTNMAAKRFDKIIVIDLESTCWEEGTEPRNTPSEIIEVGVCTLGIEKLNRDDRRSVLIKPGFSTVSEFCTKLTSLTQADVDGGTTLKAACKTLLKDYRSKDRMWASWGDYDRHMFQKNCEIAEISYPFCSTHQNIRTLFTAMMGLSEAPPLPEAMKMLNAKFEGNHHRGVDDAWNAAFILGYIMQNFRKGRG